MIRKRIELDQGEIPTDINTNKPINVVVVKTPCVVEIWEYEDEIDVYIVDKEDK